VPAAAVGGLAGLVTIPSVAAALFRALPLSFVLLAIGLIWLQRLGMTAEPRDRFRVRLAWKAAAWLLLAGGLALPLQNVAGLPAAVALIGGCAILGVAVDAIGDRVVPT
jgi:hypothetical protein